MENQNLNTFDDEHLLLMAVRQWLSEIRIIPGGVGHYLLRSLFEVASKKG